MKKNIIIVSLLIISFGGIYYSFKISNNPELNKTQITERANADNSNQEKIEFKKDDLHKAAHTGNLERVKLILKAGVDVDARDSFGGTALHAAMFQDNLEIIKILIEAGLDINAEGTSNKYTPLHDAVWDNNLEAVKILIEAGANQSIKNNLGQTPYEKAKSENKTEIVKYLDSIKNNPKTEKVKKYDETAKNTYSENDVKSFVYKWFAGFDHQADINEFKKHLDADKVEMNFPDFPIRSIADFEKWYGGVKDSIAWNTHKLSNLKVTGNEKNGFDVSFDINWLAKTYDNEEYDTNIRQDWKIKVDENRNFIVSYHTAKIIK
ncbi:MAG: ankyrin repeat domain-containing protein [Candidatus Gracilibacteria bacterium]|nr:ankyrin repeat domain-containing protein [Candidatus Gracilibacteria bacterium]